ncbi:MAG: hypothetical protein L6N95_00770 [Candidatus Methylarchaceae archaeon HK01B]|nr:hypothetical protein [Candidatus Methylarchaceae archaeon HK02M1]MCP8318345.1 hypothetical protein [Candidatus Methylarchaceae archaeon HK01B]
MKDEFNVEVIKDRLRKYLRHSEGSCGMYHQILALLSEYGCKVVSKEIPEGAISRIIDQDGNILGEGADITWPPATLRAMIDGEIIPEPWKSELKEVLTSEEDIKRVKEIFGFGRIVRPSATAISKVSSEGGKVFTERDRIGVTVAFYDKNDRKIAEARNIFCPACAAVIAASRDLELRDYIKEQLKNETNTGKMKWERGIENVFRWDNFCVTASIWEGEKKLAENWGCCTAYAIVRTEVVAGLVGSKVGKVLKFYCDQCPVKSIWFGKAMGAMGNIVLKRLSETGLKAEIGYERFLTVTVKDDSQIIGKGYGSLCALSGTINMLFRSKGIEVIKPSPAKDFPIIKEKKDA